MTSKESITIKCKDGLSLQGYLLIPPKAKAVIQFNAATGAKKEFYLPFLNYLADQGYLCCLWDYRGSGESAPAQLKDCTYTLRDYGILDMTAVKAYLQQRFPDLPLLLFGHSVGGQQVGFMEDLEGVKGLLAFAVSTGYVPHMPFYYQLHSYFFFYLFSPISIFLTGFVKAKPFGIMENLPRNVVREWRAWCRKSNYFFHPDFLGKDVPSVHFKNYDFPVQVFYATDDPISNKRSVPTFWENIESSKGIQFTTLEPSEFGVKEIGHFGFFKKSMAKKLWPMALAKLDAFLAKDQKQATTSEVKR